MMRGPETGDEPGEFQYWSARNSTASFLFPQRYRALTRNTELMDSEPMRKERICFHRRIAH
jgi:hypothetical protein